MRGTTPPGDSSAAARHMGNSDIRTLMGSSTVKMIHQIRRFRRFVRANEAVSALEYAIPVGVIAVGIATALTTFSTSLTTALNTIGTSIGAITQSTPATPSPAPAPGPGP